MLDLEYEVRSFDDYETYPPLVFDVYDQDNELLDSSDDYLARAILHPKDLDYAIVHQNQFSENRSLEIPTKPKWYPLRYAAGEPISGEILASFAVAEMDYNFKTPSQHVNLRSRVEFKEFDCNFLVLGLRGLQSPGILPVKKAFI